MRRFELAAELVRIAKSLAGIDFSTKSQMDSYLKEHPGADRSKHRVVRSPESDGKGQERGEFPKHRKQTPSVKSVSKVKNVLSAHGLDEESDEVHEMMGFKKTLGQRVPESRHGEFYVRNEKKLKSDFIRNMNPANYDSPDAYKAAVARMKKMPVGDFGKILAALSEED